MLRAFIDDSWDGNRQVAVTAGCYIGYYSDWRRLRDAWRKRLSRDGIEYFRSSEYYGLHGGLAKFRDSDQYPAPTGRDAARTLRSDLFEIINKTNIRGFAVSLPISVYYEILKTEPHADKILPQKDHLFLAAIQELFSLCIEETRRDLPGERIAFVCDDSSSYPQIAAVYQAYKWLNPAYAAQMETILPLDDKKYPQLQAADVMAHLAKERFTEWLADPQPESAKSDLNSRLRELRVQSLGHVDQKRLSAIVRHEAWRRGLTASTH